MEHLQMRANAAERAAHKAKDALEEARDISSHLSAKLEDYEERLAGMRRGREYDALRRKYDTLQDRLIASRTDVRRALDAAAKLSQKHLDLLDRICEAEDAQKPNGSRAPYEDEEPVRRHPRSRHTYTTRTTYHYGPVHGEQRESSPESSDSPTYEYEHARHRHRHRHRHEQRSRFDDYEEDYITEEHVPHRHRGRSESSGRYSEEAFMPSSRGYHPGYSPPTPDRSQHYYHPGFAPFERDEHYFFTTEEHIPRSEHHRDHEPHGDHRQHPPRGHHTHSESRQYGHHAPDPQFTTEDHTPRRSHREYNEWPEKSHRESAGDDRSGHRSSRSTPRPENGRREEYSESRSGRSAPPQSRNRAPQTPKLPSQQTVDSWWKYANQCFKDYSKIKQFPIPPALSCGSLDCDAASSTRPFAACEHTIRTSFGMVPNLNVKRERLRWHPDKFTACPANLRDNFQKMASEIFIVLDNMHKEV